LKYGVRIEGLGAGVFRRIVDGRTYVSRRAICDADGRKAIAATLGKQDPAYDPLPDIDRCIARRKQLEPAFRAWLAPEPSNK
jgi:hypothetical protein